MHLVDYLKDILNKKLIFQKIRMYFDSIEWKFFFRFVILNQVQFNWKRFKQKKKKKQRKQRMHFMTNGWELCIAGISCTVAEPVW